jgi:hypothetical protein
MLLSYFDNFRLF